MFRECSSLALMCKCSTKITCLFVFLVFHSVTAVLLVSVTCLVFDDIINEVGKLVKIL